MSTETYSIGGNLKGLRKARALTQIDLATAVGVTQPTISAWESGASQPTLGNLVRLAAVLSVTVDQILGNKAA